jgi:hypothetical protein
VINRSVRLPIPAALCACSAAVALAVFPAGSAHADPRDDDEDKRVAAIVPQAGGSTPGDTSTVLSATGEKPSDFGGSATAEVSVGIGTFAPEPHDNTLVSTTILASAFYRVTDQIRLSLAGSVTWFNVNDFYTALPNGEALLSDISVGISHGSIYRHADSGFNLSGAFRVLLPTSPGSQFQNRWFTLMPSLNASISAGDFSFSWGLGFGKFFGGSSVATVDCSDFPDPEECIQGRNANPSLGYETERRGGEVWLPGIGMNSFFFSNSLGVTWAPIDRLTLSLNLGIFTYFGLRSLPVDEFSSPHATAGRQQRDRLVSTFAVAYQLLDQLALSTSLSTDASQPFGARGDDFPVIFDFSRAAANITSINFAVTGNF